MTAEFAKELAQCGENLMVTTQNDASKAEKKKNQMTVSQLPLISHAHNMNN